MLEHCVVFALKNRLLVVLVFVLCLGLGVWTATRLPIDAFPDTTPVQVQVNTVAPSLNPEEIEQQITTPVELAVSGLPGLANVRSISKFGLSQVVATFDDATELYDARQFIMERVSSVELPDGIERPQLGPISSGLGEIFHYIVRTESPTRSLEELRTLHDWIVKPELRKVPGVAEVNAWGGYERQYQVVVSPEALVRYGLTLGEVFEALEHNNANVGGGQLVTAGEAMVVHGLGRVRNAEEIGDIVIRSHEGTPVRIRNVASVEVGHEIRHGAVTAQGKGEAVLGLGFMLTGENSQRVAAGLRERLDRVKGALPDDVIVELVYDRTSLVNHVIDTVKTNLLAGAIFVVLVLLVLLGSLRSGLLVALAIPMAMAFALLGMYEMSIAASLLSLGAMDFGILVDGSVVMTEINMRRLAARQRELGRSLTSDERFNAIADSSRQVVRPITFGMLIILIVFLPILTLEGVEGKMFKPMAWTFMFALGGALATAIFLSPVLSYYFLPRQVRPKSGRLEHWFERVYGAALAYVLRGRTVLLGFVLMLLGTTAWMAPRLGGEFIPRLGEGALVINVVRLSGVAIDESVAYNTRMEQLLLDTFPEEIEHVWSRIGTAEVATDPMGIELTDIFLTLKPRENWVKARTQDELAEQIEHLFADLPGQTAAFSQPIELRVNELLSGMRSDVGIKVFGDDFDELVRLGEEVRQTLAGIPGAEDVSADQITGQPTLQVTVRQDALARYGVAAQDVLSFVEALGTPRAGAVYEGQRHVPLVVRLPETLRTNVEALSETVLPTSAGVRLPLRVLADVRVTESPSTINREWGRRLIRVQTNVRGRDVASFVEEARAKLAERVSLPEGYVIEWGGQFENLHRSQVRLAIVVPITLALIFFLLYFSMGNLRDVLIIYTGIPFAAIGAVGALWWRGIPFSVSAAVGFIALAGIAVLNGQIMVSTIRNNLREGLVFGNAIVSGARERLRPVLATAITDAVGFIPMALSTGVGAEVQRPLATVVVGGVITSTILTLFVLPALFQTFGKEENPCGT